MKIATVAACPVFGGKLARLDDSRAKAVRGVRQVVRLDNAWRWSPITWGRPERASRRSTSPGRPAPTPQFSSADLIALHAEAVKRPGVVAAQDGDVAKAMAGAASTHRRSTSCHYWRTPPWSR